MKIKILIILLLFFSLLPANETDKLKGFDLTPRPMYEKVTLLNDYRINQPIKGAIRWGSVGLVSGAIIDLSRSSNKNYSFDYTPQMMKFGFYGGALFGIYRDIYIKVKKRAIPIFNYAKANLVMKYLMEQVFMKSTHIKLVSVLLLVININVLMSFN